MTLIAGLKHAVSSWPGGDLRLSSSEIGLHLFSLIYSTTMLNDRSGAFQGVETDVSQTGTNV